MTVLRSLTAIAAGFGLFALVVGLATPVAMDTFGVSELHTFQLSFFVTNLVYTTIAAVAAGYLCGWIVKSHEVAHAAAIGMIVIVASFVTMRQQGATQPGAYEMTMAGCAPVAAMVGAAVAMALRIRRRD